MSKLRPFVAIAVFPLIVIACGSSSSDGKSGDGGPTGSGSPNCPLVCPGVLAAHCSNGPPSQSECVSGCQMIIASKCSAKYDALYACGGSSPKYTCDTQGRVTVSGCESEGTDLYNCLASP